ncbi:MAG: hypothetical protein E7523_05230 [Ruminococcaceae bacterium]|nr:hypothetical protein [Oscillospiraceae bacterium]
MKDSTEEAAESSSDNLPSMMDEDASLCAVEDMPVVTAKKKSKTPGIVILLLLVLCIAVGGGYYAHINSDEYKTEQAQMYFNQQDYEQAEQYLTDVNTPQANELRNQIAIKKAIIAIKNEKLEEALSFLQNINTSTANTIVSFLNVENAKLAFFNEYTSTRTKTRIVVELNKDSRFPEMLDSYDDFSDAIMEFELHGNAIELPTELYQRYLSYATAVDYASNINPPFIDMIDVFRNIVIRITSGKGDYYTYRSLKKRLTAAENALDKIDVLLISKNQRYYISDATVIKNCRTESNATGTYITLSDDYFAILRGAYNACSSFAEEEAAHIQERLQKWDLDDEIYNREPDPDYEHPLWANTNCSALGAISDYESVFKSARTLQFHLVYDVLYYLLTGTYLQSTE